MSAGRKKKAKKKATTKAKRKRKAKVKPTKPPVFVEGAGAFGETPDDKGKPPAKKKVGAKSKTKVIPPEIDKNSRAFLRYSAGVYYTTHMGGIAVKDIANHPVYGVVPYNTIAKWAISDRWVARRKEIREKWRRAIEDRIGNELVQARVTQLQSLENLYTTMIQKLETQLIEANSYEGMVNALVKLAQVIDDWRGKLGEQIVPDLASGPSRNQPRLQPQVSQEEAVAAAKVIMALRRDQIRKSKEQDEEPEPAPVLQLVEGSSE